MGWASGSDLAESLWNDIKNNLSPTQKEEIKKAIIKNFEDYDCDTMDEVKW